MWYGESRYNTPKLGEFDREAGEFIEMKLFGGIVDGAYDSKTEDIKMWVWLSAITFIQYVLDFNNPLLSDANFLN